MRLGSKQTLITAYAALATIAVGTIGFDLLTRKAAADTFADDFKMESVAHLGATEQTTTANSSATQTVSAAL